MMSKSADPQASQFSAQVRVSASWVLLIKKTFLVHHSTLDFRFNSSHSFVLHFVGFFPPPTAITLFYVILNTSSNILRVCLVVEAKVKSLFILCSQNLLLSISCETLLVCKFHFPSLALVWLCANYFLNWLIGILSYMLQLAYQLCTCAWPALGCYSNRLHPGWASNCHSLWPFCELSSLSIRNVGKLPWKFLVLQSCRASLAFVVLLT